MERQRRKISLCYEKIEINNNTEKEVVSIMKDLTTCKVLIWSRWGESDPRPMVVYKDDFPHFKQIKLYSPI